jgi:L-cystine transport system substrate-binding protein
MRKKNQWNRVIKAVAVVSLGALVLSGCGQAAETSENADTQEEQAVQEVQEETSDQGEVQVIKIAAGPLGAGGNSLNVNENDELDGSDIAILKEIDARLDDYEFEYIATSFDDVLVGLDTGAYDGGLINAFLTAERIEKYAIPQENIGASFIGILALNENAEGITSLDDVVRAQQEEGKTFYPMQAGNGLTYIVDVYNEEHPDAPVVFDYTSENTNGDVASWIVTKRYDFGLVLQEGWQQSFEAEEGALHDYVDSVTWIPLQSVGTYPLFNKNSVDQKFLDAFDETLAEMKTDGTTTAIFEKYFGYDKLGLTIENLAER